MKGADALSEESTASSAKKASGEALQNLCQMRLFAADNAPSSLGTSLQELYQEKETNSLHAAKSLSDSDLPPGFVNVGAGITGSGANTVVGMDIQVKWHCPEKFLLRAVWQVAAGSESTEFFAEQRREVGVLEALYPRINVMPTSPVEPLGTMTETKDTSVPEIPIFLVENEDEHEDSTPGGDASPRKSAVKKETGEKGGSSSSGPLSSWSANQVDQGLSSFFMKEADPNVAAAAAAAYAVLRAKERGALVDHDLLIKILTNPILIKTLLQCKHSVGLQLRAASEEIEKQELGRSLGSTSLESKLFGWPIPSGTKASFSAGEILTGSATFQGWNTSNPFGSTRPFLGSRTEEIFFPRKEIQGMGGSSGQLLSNRQDAIKDLLQLGIDRNRNDAAKGLTDMKPMSASDRHRHPILGPFSQLGPGSQHASVSTSGRGDGFSHTRFGGEQSQSRYQKPCIYFNTPKGCRRGASCFYMHNTASEQPYGEQSRTEFLPFQSAKRPKFGIPERD